MVENFRPGTLERWGLGWAELSAIRPELIMVRISGFGQTGPYAQRAGYASIGEAMGGGGRLMSSTYPPAQPEQALADHRIFRDVIGRFASGVTVITTAIDGARFGTTASAVSSLSLEPPMVLVCLNKSSETQAAVLKAGTFCVNILAEGQQELAYRFAGKGDKFAGVV